MSDRYLVISDVDGTLLGDAVELNLLRQWAACQGGRVEWVYSSGRFCQSLRESVANEKLPNPVALIGGVGTEVCSFPAGDTIGGWRKDLAVQFSATLIRNKLKSFPRLALQPEEFQSELKVSYFLHDALTEELTQVETILRELHLDIQLVYSSQRDLDILPLRANKGNAARFIAQHLGFQAKQVVVAGDSANDLAMFQVGFRGIVVNNAHRELKAMESQSVVVTRRSYAGGVLEGLLHWVDHKRV
jgi:sucrose-6F-phosphate phosphohydrolase